MTAIDNLRAYPSNNSEPPLLTELLRAAILEVVDRLEEDTELLWSTMNKIPHAPQKPRQKYKPRKTRKPREDKGADPSAVAPARANPSGTPPPDGPPVPSPDTKLRTWGNDRRVTEGAPD